LSRSEEASSSDDTSVVPVAETGSEEEASSSDRFVEDGADFIKVSGQFEGGEEGVV